jgi:hypothetical protein
MTNEDTKTIVQRLVRLYPKAEWNDEQGATWREFLLKFSYADANRAVSDHFKHAKFAPKPSDLSWRINEYAAERNIDIPHEEKPAESFADMLRRIHKIPSTTSDADVLIWYHRQEVGRIRHIYRSSSHIAKLVDRQRSKFRADYVNASLDGALGWDAECMVFGTSDESEKYWATMNEVTKRLGGRAASVQEVVDMYGLVTGKPVKFA